MAPRQGLDYSPMCRCEVREQFCRDNLDGRLDRLMEGKEDHTAGSFIQHTGQNWIGKDIESVMNNMRVYHGVNQAQK